MPRSRTRERHQRLVYRYSKFIMLACLAFINFKKTAFVASQKKCCKAAHIFKRDPKFKLNFKKLEFYNFKEDECNIFLNFLLSHWSRRCLMEICGAGAVRQRFAEPEQPKGGYPEPELLKWGYPEPELLKWDDSPVCKTSSTMTNMSTFKEIAIKQKLGVCIL